MCWSEHRLNTVAQICNLPYRRIVFCGPCEYSPLTIFEALPITNRRYSRLQICATRQSRHIKHNALSFHFRANQKRRSAWRGVNELDCAAFAEIAHLAGGGQT